MSWRIEPTFMEGAEIIYPSEYDSSLNTSMKVAMVISDIPGKTYSTVTKIKKFTKSDSIREPLIKIDKNIVGPLIANDKVILKEYFPPVGKQVTLAISNRYILVEGNWGNTIVNPAVNKQIFDDGSLVEFMYGTQNPMFVQAYVKSSIPKAPILISNDTLFIVEKMELSKIANLQAESDQRKEKRAREYLSQMQNETFDLINLIKSDNANEYQKSFNFSQVAPLNIFSGIRQKLMNSFSFLTDIKENFEDGSFIGTLVVIPKQKSIKKPANILEFQVSGKMNEGKVNLTIYSLNKEKTFELSSTWEKTIKNLAGSMKEIPQAVPDICSACGARLDLSTQNEKGIVFCPVCSSPNLLPFSLRTF